MHWSEELAQKVIDKSPNKEEYVCAAGISPSGSIHIGNFRDIATSYFVCRALQKKGKKARLLFSWDEFDRLRKVPVNVSAVAEDFEQHIGRPYDKVPDPFGCCTSYAEHFEKEFEESLKKFGIPVDFRYQGKEYRSGRYKDHIITALKKRKEIFDILEQFRTQESTPEQRENYYPVTIYCPVCGKDTTKVKSLNDDCTEAQYFCKCGHEGTFNFLTDFDCKLPWKVDWPMRWMVEGVDFEPGGKDHASPMGSYQTSRIIAKDIFGYEAPIFQGYEFIGLKGMTGKMSGSSGLNITPGTLLKIYEPEVILWLYSKTEPTKAFNFCFDDEILRQYFEFDKGYDAYLNGTADDHTKEIYDNVTVEGHTIKAIPMQQLAFFSSLVNFNNDMLETVFEKIGTPHKREEFAERLELARYWMENYRPDAMNKLLPIKSWEYFLSLSPEEQQEIKILFDFLQKGDYTLDSLNTFLYSVPEQVRTFETDKEKKKAQGNFFKNVYQILIGKTKGPRLYLFLFALEPSRFLPLLDFTGEAPSLEELKKPINNVKETIKEKIQAKGEQIKEKVKEIKENAERKEITIDDFKSVELRVCQVKECCQVPRSRNLLQLTLDDGTENDRTIVSGIKNYYAPEELVGRKIIVVANLKPAKLCGVLSQGMLIAGSTNEICKVVFVDDAVPVGTVLG